MDLHLIQVKLCRQGGLREGGREEEEEGGGKQTGERAGGRG
jgi:hypothetical protein